MKTSWYFESQILSTLNQAESGMPPFRRCQPP